MKKIQKLQIMKKSIKFFISFLLIGIAQFSVGQVNGLVEKNGICDTLERLYKMDNIEFVKYEDFFMRMSKKSNLKYHWKLSEAGLIYDNREDLELDILGWRYHFGCSCQ